jgi:hypothetical protein
MDAVSLILKVTRDACSLCLQAEREGFFANLYKLKLGPEGSFGLTNLDHEGSRLCPNISCKVTGRTRPGDSKRVTFNATYSETHGWVRSAEQKKVSIQNVQDFCDNFISMNEAPAPTPVCINRESLFSYQVFMIKDDRATTWKKIFHELLPESVISVRRMISDLDLLGKVKCSLEPLDDEFWVNKSPTGLVGSAGCSGSIPTVLAPIKNNCIVLRITGELLSKLPRDSYDDFKLTLGPRNNSLRTVTQTSQTKDVIESNIHAVVPSPEAHDVLDLSTRKQEVKSVITKYRYEFIMIVSDLEGNLNSIREFLNDVVSNEPVRIPFER